MFEALQSRGFQFEFHSHAFAILTEDFPEALAELEQALDQVSIPIEELIGSGGGETKGTQRLRRALTDLRWPKATFKIEKTVNGKTRESVSHEIDHARTLKNGVIALEIEWNNKDPFFDRDLENFKRLHAEGAISVGVVVTRGRSLQDEMVNLVERFAAERQLRGLQDVLNLGLNPTRRQEKDFERRMKSGLAFPQAWARSFVQDKFGRATTHWDKMEDRVRRGVGNPCPLLLVGLPTSVVTFGEGLDVDAIAGGDELAIS